FQGSFEPETSATLMRLAAPGMTVLDIGANIGWHTCRLAKRVEHGKVIAFEPMSWARERLLRNLQLNGMANVIVEDIALSDSNEGRCSLHFRCSWQLNPMGQRSVENPQSLQPEAVDVMTLDSYIRNQSIGRVDLIKLDVDGYELRVLSGARETLSRW